MDASLTGEQGNVVIGTVKTGREAIEKRILNEAQLNYEFGIELVDVKIKRINYEGGVQESVFGRMIAERKQIAEKFRSEGQGEAER
jgi:membrane protease subunit HflC